MTLNVCLFKEVFVFLYGVICYNVDSRATMINCMLCYLGWFLMQPSVIGSIVTYLMEFFFLEKKRLL